MDLNDLKVGSRRLLLNVMHFGSVDPSPMKGADGQVVQSRKIVEAVLPNSAPKFAVGHEAQEGSVSQDVQQ